MATKWNERYHVGQSCYVVIDGQRFDAVVTSDSPPKAKITTLDKVWLGCEVGGKFMRAKREGLPTRHDSPRGTDTPAVLKSDLRTLARNGVTIGSLDENKVLRTLIELEAEGLVKRTSAGGNEWEAVFIAEPVKAKQGSLFE